MNRPDTDAVDPSQTKNEDLGADPLLACQSLLNLFSFAIGSTFANLAGARLIDRNDAADRLRLLAESMHTVPVSQPEITTAMVERLQAMADAIATGKMLH